MLSGNVINHLTKYL